MLNSIHPKTDEELANWLNNRLSQKHRVAYIHADYLCKFVDLDEPNLTLLNADPHVKAKASMKKLVSNNLLTQLEMQLDTLNDAKAAESSWTYSKITKNDVDNLLEKRNALLGRTSGRGPQISNQTAQKVWADAGGRCMFEGCACDLTTISLWHLSARVGYLAHIVASNPNGPRGNQDSSHKWADAPENIMLMCDAHHRLIDSLAPNDFPAARLDIMRKKHCEQVKLYLNALSYPPSRAVTLHANLANVPTYFHDTAFIDAILATGCSMLPNVTHYIRRENQIDDRSTPNFWVSYLREHERDINILLTSFRQTNSTTIENISVFPLHHVPTMLLAGRIIGEAQSIKVFQYDRENQSWAWNAKTVQKTHGTFSVSNLPKDQAQEVLITIELTALIDENAIPTDLKTNLIPWLRITAKTPSFNCIGHPNDLNQFIQVARGVINHVQDTMRAKKVHLIAISPASTVFCFGQLLQAGHHPEYIVYDRAGNGSPFGPAFSINSHSVSAIDGGHSFSINLR